MKTARIDKEYENDLVGFATDVNDLLCIHKHKGKKTNVYFAGPWFDDRARYLYESVRRELDKFEKYRVYYPVDHTAKTPKKTFDDNVRNIKNAEIVIALIDRKDTGTAWEIGLAQGLEKEVILVAIDEDSFKSGTNIMLAFCGKALLLKNFTNYMLTRNPNYLYRVKNTWEGKQ